MIDLFIGYVEDGNNYLLHTINKGNHEVHILYMNNEFINFKITYYE